MDIRDAKEIFSEIENKKDNKKVLELYNTFVQCYDAAVQYLIDNHVMCSIIFYFADGPVNTNTIEYLKAIEKFRSEINHRMVEDSDMTYFIEFNLESPKNAEDGLYNYDFVTGMKVYASCYPKPDANNDAVLPISRF